MTMPPEPDPKPASSRGWVGGGRRRAWAELPTLANLALLALFPLAWWAPLAKAGVLPFFGGREISVLSGVAALWEADPALSILVAAFAIAVPYAKTLVLTAAHFGWSGARAVGWVEIVGKLSMADVFLIALYIIVAKGVGVGYVASAWGLWLFTLCVLVSLWVGHVTKKRLGERPA